MPSYPQWAYFADGFHGSNGMSNIWTALAIGNGNKALTWSSDSVDDTAGSGSVHVQGWPGIQTPNNQPNVVAQAVKTGAVSPGKYSIEGRFKTDNLTNLWGYQLMVWFQVSGVYHQATFHSRMAGGGLPPNDGGQGVYVYDQNDNPQRLGDCYYPNATGQWCRMYGEFDTRTLRYGNVVHLTAGGTNQFDASSISFVNTSTQTWTSVRCCSACQHGGRCARRSAD